MTSSLQNAVPTIGSDGDAPQVGGSNDINPQVALLNGAIEATSLGIWEWDIKSNDVYWSERQRQIFSVSDFEETTYELWLSRIHPDDREWVEATARNLLNPISGGRMHIQHRLQFPNGTTRWIESHARMIYEGEIATKLLGTVTDITRRKEAEDALTHSLAALEVALDAADAVPWQYNIATRQIRWSPRVTKLFSAADTTLSPTLDEFLQAVHPDDRTALRDVREREGVASKGDKFTLELRLLRPDGKEVWIERRSIIGDDVGDGRWVIGVDLDITARKLASETQSQTLRTLELERERLAVALLTGRLGVYEWQIGDTDIWWSPETYALYGVSSDVFRPTVDNFTQLVHPDDREELWQKSRVSFEQRSHFEHEYRVVSPDGRTRWVANRSRVSIDINTGKDRIIGIAVDVTERREHEEHIRLLMREVNHRSKNLLAVVQAIASQSAHITDPSSFARRFSERLQGLAASHDLLVKGLWKTVDLKELIRSQLLHFGELFDKRILIQGPPLAVSPSSAQALGMALHELVTNAVKYGALSNRTGRVFIDWSIGENEFRLTWNETGGPSVFKPDRLGFGTIVMTRLVDHSLGGTTTLEYRGSGIEWAMQCSTSSIEGGA